MLAIHVDDCIMSSTRAVNAVKKVLLLQYVATSVVLYLALHNAWLTQNDLHCSWKKQEYKDGWNQTYETLLSNVCFNQGYNDRFSTIYLGLEFASVFLLLLKILPRKPNNAFGNIRSILANPKLMYGIAAGFKLILIFKLLPSQLAVAEVKFGSVFGVIWACVGTLFNVIIGLAIQTVALPLSLLLPYPIKPAVTVDFLKFAMLVGNYEQDLISKTLPGLTKEIQCRQICRINSSFSRSVIVTLLLVCFSVVFWLIHIAENFEGETERKEILQMREQVSESVEFIRVSEVSDDFNYEVMLKEEKSRPVSCDVCKENEVLRVNEEKEVLEEKRLVTDETKEPVAHFVEKADKNCQTMSLERNVMDQVSQTVSLERKVRDQVSQTVSLERKVNSKVSQKVPFGSKINNQAPQTVHVEHKVNSQASQTPQVEHIVNSQASQTVPLEHKVNSKASQTVHMEHNVNSQATQTVPLEHKVNSQASQTVPLEHKVNSQASQTVPLEHKLNSDFEDVSLENSANKLGIEVSNNIRKESLVSSTSAISDKPNPKLKLGQRKDIAAAADGNVDSSIRGSVRLRKPTKSKKPNAYSVSNKEIKQELSNVNSKEDISDVKSKTEVGKLERQNENVKSKTEVGNFESKGEFSAVQNKDKVANTDIKSEFSDVKSKDQLSNANSKNDLGKFESNEKLNSKMELSVESNGTENLARFSFSELSLVPSDLDLEEKIKQRSFVPNMNTDNFLSQLKEEENKHQIYVEKELLMSTLTEIILTARITGSGDCDICPKTHDLVKECTCPVHNLIKSIIKGSPTTPDRDSVDGSLESINGDFSDDESFFCGFRL